MWKWSLSCRVRRSLCRSSDNELKTLEASRSVCSASEFSAQSTSCSCMTKSWQRICGVCR